MSEESDPRLYYPHVARNREPILRVLKRVLPPRGLILELASGSGEHVTYFAQMLPTLLWQPTDPDPRALASIAAHRTAANAPNLLSRCGLTLCRKSGRFNTPMRWCAST
jgi:tRNA G46 methylase TrmB